MNGLRQFIFPALLLVISTFGCSKSNVNSPNIDPGTGKHPSGWVVAGAGTHPTAFFTAPSSCYECHGMDLKGGISAVSCFTASRNGMNCHANGPSRHPTGWEAASAHGLHAKAQAIGNDGIARCQICHGSDFSGGIARKTCLNTAGCHGATVASPHPPKPWLSRLGTSTHTTTDVSNAPACALCHTSGANSARRPSTPATAGTAPDCFNNTLCHGAEGHPAGWKAANVHGVAAKGVSSAAAGFKYCTSCHGSDYAGGSAQQSCLNSTGCHGSGIRSPHPGAPWRSGSRSHTSTDTNNDFQCAVCHTGGANSSRRPNPAEPVGASGCFNNTLCHGTSGHTSGWKASNVHGAEAKKAPTGSTGFASCKSCHGATFINGSATTCLNNSACHGNGVNAPHAAKPWFSRTSGQPTHTTTNVGNVDVCAGCHTAGANSEFGVRTNAAVGVAGCFNNTLCHYHPVDSVGTFKSPAVHGPMAKSDLTVCQACHGIKGSSSFDGLTLADGSKTIACSSCHAAAKAHPTDWQGSGSYSHRSAGNSGVACAICHKTNAPGTSPLATAPSCLTASFSNALGGPARTCHASGPGVTPHAVPYNNHNATARSNFGYCQGCHPDSANAVNSKPPGCQNCHLTSPVLASSGCISCHAKPPTAQNYPNSVGSHAGHVSFNITQNADQTATCNECHSGLGVGTIDHLDRSRARSASIQANPVVFGIQLSTVLGSTPAFNSPTTGQCANTYCHGVTLSGGGSNKSPRWGQTGYMTAAGCGTCHGFPPTTVRNGTAAHSSSSSCSGCHPHVNSTNNGFNNRALHIDGKVDASGGTTHAVPYPGANHKTAGATASACSICHNTTRTGGTYPAVPGGSAPDCRACHKSGLGAGCADCHMSPPNGTTAPNRAFAHAKHLSSVITTSVFTCNDCHMDGGDPSLLHGYGTTAVSFGSFAKTGSLAPVYNSPTAGQCANVYCHGATLAGGSNKAPAWNQTMSGCATCHGFPPTTVRNGTAAHSSSSSCSGCHPHVNASNTGFTDAGKHINGTVEASNGHSFPFQGSLHLNTAGSTPWSACLGCHSNSAGGTYPVAAGVAPNCTGCHINGLKAPVGASSCWDCHGSSATNGRPNGSTFPNIARRHTNPSYHGVDCVICHAGGGTGVLTHGNGNRISKTIFGVTVGFSSNATATVTGMSFTRNGTTGRVSCSGTCHSTVSSGKTFSHSNDSW